MKKKLKKIAKDTNSYLAKYLKFQKKTELIFPMNYGLLPGGKKIRTKILIDVGKIFKVKYQNLVKIGAAVECIHAYSLIHDDLPCMDNDNLRRGKLSTHRKFGESTAILAGNSLLTIAFEILSQNSLKINNKIKIKLINLISKCSGHSGIAGGQYSDLKFEKKKIALNKIIEMQEKKTGFLDTFPVDQKIGKIGPSGNIKPIQGKRVDLQVSIFGNQGPRESPFSRARLPW